jgi:hypothetical protein
MQKKRDFAMQFALQIGMVRYRSRGRIARAAHAMCKYQKSPFRQSARQQTSETA